jgi:hypothetical protein
LKKIIITLIILLPLNFSCNTKGDSDKTINHDPIIDKNPKLNSDNNSLSKDNKADDNLMPQSGANNLKQENENIVFSFKTDKNKTMNLVMDKDEKYVAYRFGDEQKVELQFPEKLENTFDQFTYNYYMRGGGPSNEGLDLNYISFEGDTHKFIVFQEYSYNGPKDDDQSLSVGIRIINLSNNKETIIKGNPSTVKGSLIDFRFNGLIKVKEGEI